MTIALTEVLTDLDDLYSTLEVLRVVFYRGNNLAEIYLGAPKPLKFQEFKMIEQKMSDLCQCNCSLFLQCENEELKENELHRFLNSFYDHVNGCECLQESTVFYNAKENTLNFQIIDDGLLSQGNMVVKELGNYLRRCGLNHLECFCSKLELPESEEIKIETVPFVKKEESAPKKSNDNSGFSQNKYSRRKSKEYHHIDLKDVHDPETNVEFIGEIFAKEEIEITKKDMIIQTLSVFDGESAILVKRFEGKFFTREDIYSVEENDRIKVSGNISYDTYANDLVCIADKIEKLDPIVVVDEAEEKRVELHMHTNMSEMDGVCDIEEVINFAWNLGHKGICITDHADVQSFVKAFNLANKLKKGDPDREFKVGLGCEMNMVNDELIIVRNPNDDSLDQSTYIVFDLETTGLSCYFDHVIEFGAVKMKQGMILGRKQLFVKPPVPIPGFITQKTNISEDMVKDAKTFEEVADELLEFIGDGVLVAHNATFDYHFMNAELLRCGRKPLTNPTIDTLTLSKAVLVDRKYYRLGSIARNYHVEYNEDTAHRADYDAEVLSNVFSCLLKDCINMGAKTISDLQTMIPNEETFKKDFISHIIVMIKNKKGLKSLYRLVTESMTKSLSCNMNSNKADATAQPLIKRSSLEKVREDLLFGTSCLNNEVFKLACNGDDERLEEAMSFYDYVEIQPLANYSTEVVLGSIPSMDRLREVILRIIKMAKKLNIPIVADSDAHYCLPKEKIFRDVYIMNQGVGGVIHPLYIRDENIRLRTKNPDQHLRLTNEMLNEFSWLNDDDLVHEIVIENPNMIFEQLEEVRPVPEGTFPPHMEGSDKKLQEICYETAKKIYEYNGEIPHQVTERLDRELEAIITAGYYVNYYISHLLVKKSNEDGYIVGSRGSVGSSFAATMSGITEVNPLTPHHICPNCHYSIWYDESKVKSGFDLEDKVCPHCGTMMKGDGHNIPFETFLGFKGDKVPDIDLNFSNEYQANAHAFTKEVFGEDHAFRAGTIGTVAEKTAFGYVSGYCEKMKLSDKEKGIDMKKVMKDYLTKGCRNVKRTTGQHPGGIIIIPDQFDAEDFTPVQFPANDPHSEWKTTHYDFHDIHDNVLKFDILGHVDPTAMRLLTNCSEVDPTTIPMNDPETLSLFSCDDALKADKRIYNRETGALGLPEFGTATTRKVLEETRPKRFSDLVIISGLSHGTDVWAGNAQSLIQQGHTIDEVIGCRDDIMTYLLDKKLEPIDSFKIMEDVRKGRGLKEEQEKTMREHQVPEWYIESCKKIKYMFPKAHAVAYVLMAVRIAWYKVHEPWNFYIQYLTLRCDTYEITTMTAGIEVIRNRMENIREKMNNRIPGQMISNKEKALYDVLEVCEEMYARGYSIGNIDLYKSKATEFTVCKENVHVIIPPFTVIDGLGVNVAKSIVNARKDGEFLSKEDLIKRTSLSESLMDKLDKNGVLTGLPDSNQLSLF